MMKRWLLCVREQRGNVLALTVLFLGVMLAFSGIAVDVGRAMSAKAELQRAFDAGSLAGAAKLAFGDSTSFPTAGNTAVNWASLNPYKGGTPTLTWSSTNSGSVKVGSWNVATQTWTPTLGGPGTIVNAVRCNWTATIPTTFLGIIGMPTLNVTAASIAFRGPPATCTNPDGTPCAIAPFALPSCSFTSGGPVGCGTMISTIQGGSGAGVWAELYGTPGANAVRDELTAALNGSPATQDLYAGNPVNTINGSVSNATDLLAEFTNAGGWHWKRGAGESGFIKKFEDTGGMTVESPVPDPTKYVSVYTYDANGVKSTTPVYTGPGWTIVVPVIAGLPCTGSVGGGPMTISTFTYLTIVQVINQGYCAVNNPGFLGAAPWNSLCAVPPDPLYANGASPLTPRDSNLRAIYGYYNCQEMNSVTANTPAPLTSFATKPRLAQ